MRNLSGVCGFLIVAGAMLCMSGCATQPTAPELSESARQENALRHPFDYSPGLEDPNISGGGFGDFDAKAFGKDLNHVLDP